MTSTVPAPVAGDQRAIVWTPLGMAAPASLVESLKKRGVPLVTVHSELVALAYTCSSHNNETVAGGTLVVLCDAPKLPRVAETVVAMRRYAASAVVYVFQPGPKLSLREVEDQDLVDWGAPAAKPIHHEPTPEPKSMPKPSQPKLRLTEPMPAPETAKTGETPDPPVHKTEEMRAGWKSAPQENIPAPQSPPPAAPVVRDDAPPSDVLSADELAMLLGRNEDGGRP